MKYSPIIILLFAVIGCSSSGNTTPATSTPKPILSPAASNTAQSSPPSTAPAPTSSVASFTDGTHTVGKEIQPGTYRTRVSSPGCYWQRLKGFSGEMTDTLANGIESGPMVVTIKDNDAGFESKKCGTWTKDLSPITSSPTAPFGDGSYIVGTDISPGTWRSDSPEDCYWERLKEFTGGMNATIANSIGKGIVTIAKTDKGFRTNKCGTWTKAN